ncbi:hypothetical protein BpHYR1_023226 [Brachionus plicatilis]|uniref:Uncharacterized protein n=1 Tax=Brachionus plicatilis TaxID=10195 RepID=A0A3M7STD0_BRAPC|nr:hypothetical protein BpHYR1_023226 [Brachionus plicatilis]
MKRFPHFILAITKSLFSNFKSEAVTIKIFFPEHYRDSREFCYMSIEMSHYGIVQNKYIFKINYSQLIQIKAFSRAVRSKAALKKKGTKNKKNNEEIHIWIKHTIVLFVQFPKNEDKWREHILGIGLRTKNLEMKRLLPAEAKKFQLEKRERPKRATNGLLHCEVLFKKFKTSSVTFFVTSCAKFLFYHFIPFKIVHDIDKQLKKKYTTY